MQELYLQQLKHELRNLSDTTEGKAFLECVRRIDAIGVDLNCSTAAVLKLDFSTTCKIESMLRSAATQIRAQLAMVTDLEPDKREHIKDLAENMDGRADDMISDHLPRAEQVSPSS